VQKAIDWNARSNCPMFPPCYAHEYKVLSLGQISNLKLRGFLYFLPLPLWKNKKYNLEYNFLYSKIVF